MHKQSPRRWAPIITSRFYERRTPGPNLQGSMTSTTNLSRTVPAFQFHSCQQWPNGKESRSFFRLMAVKNDPVFVKIWEEERWDVIPGGEPHEEFDQRVWDARRRALEGTRLCSMLTTCVVRLRSGAAEVRLTQDRRCRHVGRHLQTAGAVPRDAYDHKRDPRLGDCRYSGWMLAE